MGNGKKTRESECDSVETEEKKGGKGEREREKIV